MRIKMENIVNVLSRKGVVGVLVVLLLFTSFYSLKALGAPDTLRMTEKTSGYSSVGMLTHTALLANNTLYGRTLSRDYYPAPLVEGFVLNYRYHFTPGDVVRGNYTISGKVTYYVTRGKDKVILWEEPLLYESGQLENGAFSKDFALDMVKLANETERISEQLDMRRITRDVTYSVRVNVIGIIKGNTVEESFSQDMSLARDASANLYYFTNTEKSNSGSVTETRVEPTTISVLGVNVKSATAKVLFPILSFILLTPLLGGVYTITASRERHTGLEGYIVEGAPPFVEKKVHLKSFEDLKKTFELLDRPIIHYKDDGDVYVMVDEGVAYEYREN